MKYWLVRAAVFPLLLIIGLSPGSAAEGDEAEYRSFGKALVNGDFGVTLRYRYEDVREDLFAKDARASTLRTTLYYRSALFHGLGLMLEFQDVTDLGLADDHANLGAGDSNNGVTDRPPIPDPPLTQAHQVWARYSGLPRTDFIVGRQEILLGDQRYVGNVGWRQNHQSFNSIRLDQRSIPLTRLTYAYVGRTNTVLGASRDMDTHLLDVEVTIDGAGRVTPYYYRIDYDEALFTGLSTQTLGARWQSEWEPGGSWTFPYHVELAKQRDVGSNPSNVDANYARLIFTASREKWWVRVWYELLGGSTEDGRFTTPLATLHAFNGWADLFVLTPANGLQDLNLAAGGKWKRLEARLILHDFNSDSQSLHYGTELDGEVRYTSSWKQVFAFAFALYDADEFLEDTNKFWLWTAYKFGRIGDRP